MKKLQWKLISMFTLLVFSVMLLFALFLQFSITQFYCSNFRQEMSERAFTQELKERLLLCLEAEDPVDELTDTLTAFSARIGIDTSRNFYILDKRNAAVLASSVNTGSVDKTPNLLAAMADRVGDHVDTSAPVMDYALPIGDIDGGYIIYIIDTKEELYQLTGSTLQMIIQAMIAGVIFAMILSFFLSRTITRPIANLTRRADALARGVYPPKQGTPSNDEIGKLTSSFHYMARVIEQSLNEATTEKNKLETILLHMTDGVIAFDLTGKIIHINPAAEEMLHIENISEIRFDSLFRELQADISMAEMVYLQRSEARERHITIGNKYYKVFFASFLLDEKTIGGVVTAIQDITEAQELENARREFVANVSHELRTPLTTIKSYAETLLDSSEDPQEKRFLSVIGREVDRMTRIVKDLLTLSSLDSGKLSANMTSFPIEELLSVVVQNLSVPAEQRGQTLTYTSVTETPLVFGDPDRLEQVMVNLVSNAVKYTPEGGTIEVFSGYLYNEVYVKIKDNGIGIPEKDLPRIFDRFYRVDKHRSRESGGTGLGLAIARDIVEKHSGTIQISSTYGEGTEVIVKLPAGGEAV